MSDFSPAQLDAIEDALEELDALGVPGSTRAEGGGPAVAERLEEYREILQWTRDAMPLQEVTPGLLDGVLEEARSVAPVTVSAVAPAEESTSWWKKLRGVFLIPALAVAGSAALVLLLVQPGSKDEPDATLATRAGEQPSAAAEAKLADDEAPARQLEEGKPAGVLENGIADASVDQELSRGRLRLEDDAAGRAGGAIEGEEEARSQAAPAAEPPPPPPEPAQAKKRDSNKPSDKIYYDEGGPPAKQSKSGGAAAPGGLPTPVAPSREDAGKGAPVPEEPNASVDEKKKDEAQSPAADDAPDAWGTIADADKARRAGDCSAARAKYKAQSTAKDSRVRARALAGLGLCETNEKAAEGWFSKARKADPDVAGFINHERGGTDNAQADVAE